MSPIPQDVARLRKSAPKLNKLLDDATSQIRALDVLLAELGVGVDILRMNRSVHSARECNSSNHFADADYHLDYARADGGKFGLVIRAVVEATDEDGRVLRDDVGEAQTEVTWVRPLAQVGSDIRLAAIPHLPDLIKEIADVVESRAAKLETTIGDTRGVLDEIKAALRNPETQNSGTFSDPLLDDLMKTLPVKKK